MFRGGPYGGDNDYASTAQRTRPVPRARTGRGPPHGRPEHRAGQRRRRLDLVKPEHWIFEGTGMKKGRPHSRPDRLGVPRRPGRIPGLEIVAAGPPGFGGERPARGRRRSIPGPRGTSSSTPRRSSGAQGLRLPPGHTLPWSHWSRPHGPDPRVQQITLNLLRRAGCLP